MSSKNDGIRLRENKIDYHFVKILTIKLYESYGDKITDPAKKRHGGLSGDPIEHPLL